MSDVITVTVFKCPNCGREYRTKEEAEACSRPAHTLFQRGDLISEDPDYLGRVCKVYEASRAGVSVVWSGLARVVRGEIMRPNDTKLGFFPGLCCGRYKKLSMAAADKAVADLERRLRAAKRLQKAVAAMHARDKDEADK